MTSRFGLSIGHASSVGRVREVNEDSYLVMTPPSVSPPVEGLLVVADGVGGAKAGEVASGVLVKAFRGWFVDNRYQESVHYNPAHADYFVAALKDLLESVNATLVRMAGDNAGLASMGTTATVALLSQGKVYVGHVGDTRAYLLRGQQIQQLTSDHTWVADEVAAGRMSPESAATHPRKHVISRVLGASPVLRVDRQAYPVQLDDTLVLATDGLTGLVSDAEIFGMVNQARTPQEAAGRLVQLANERGGGDNITVVVGRVVPAGQGVNGLGPQGVALSSVYLGQTAGQVVAVPPAPSPPAQTERSAGLLATLVLWLAPVIAAVALGAGVYGVVANETAVTVAGYTLSAPVLASALAVVAVVAGFMFGYLAHKAGRNNS